MTTITQDNAAFPQVADWVVTTTISPIRGSTRSTPCRPCCAWSRRTDRTPRRLEARRLGGLHGVDGLGVDLPDWRPGCGSLSVDPNRTDELAVRFSGSTMSSRRVEIAALEDEWEALYDRDWSDGLPVVPPPKPAPSDARGRHSRPRRGRGRRATGPRRRDRREDRDQRRDGRLQARLPPGRHRRSRGDLHRRLQHARRTRHHDGCRPHHHRQRADRPERSA